MRKQLFFIILFIGFNFSVQAQVDRWMQGNYAHPWADSILKTLNLKECIAQTMMIPAWSNKTGSHITEVEKLVSEYKVGGIIFFQGDPLKQVYLTNYYQQQSKVPLFIGIDGEWGAAMRLSGIERFPYQMTMGAMRNDFVLFQIGWAIGEQCRQMGIHINFAPDVDVNTNEKNPIIGFRSFGDNAKSVALQSSIILKGMQSSGIIACAKHFPGHGDTESDSHLDLPALYHSKARLDSVDLIPFKQSIADGVKSIMVAHLAIPSLEPNPNIPSSLSPKVVDGLLKTQMGFKGLIITDALNMKGVKKNYGPGYAELQAIKAGNDILCFPENVPKAIDLVYDAILKGELDSNELKQRVQKILFFKAQSGLDKSPFASTDGLMQRLASVNRSSLIDSVAQFSITIATDKNQILPVSPNKKKTIVWQIGSDFKSNWKQAILKFENVEYYYTNKNAPWIEFDRTIKHIKKIYDRVIVSAHDQAIWGAAGRKLGANTVNAINLLNKELETITVLFCQPYVLADLQYINCAIVAYEDLPNFYTAAANIIYGKRPAVGVLPVGVGNSYKSGSGVFTTNKVPQMLISDWQYEGFARDFSPAIERIMRECVKSGAAPGGQVLVARNGHIVYHKPFGFKTYDSVYPVDNSQMYDIASITKIASTTLAAMKLYEQGLLKLDEPIQTYLPQAANTNKANITPRQLLLHEAGLESWIPFYRQAIIDGGVFSPIQDDHFSLQISNNCYMNKDYQAEMWRKIWESPIHAQGRFVYSDLSMILLQQCIESITGMALNDFVYTQFYKPMRLTNINFNPFYKYNSSTFAPTQDDLEMRFGIVNGFVHDPASSMFGGVCGHAGLFSNAQDLACIMQMLLNKGVFNGIQFFKPETVDLFTKKQNSSSRRALGFDKPNGRYGSKNNVSGYASSSTFGHSGFTGTWAWADPKENLVFIMLTNRTYPLQDNGKLVGYNIRGRVLDAVYKALP